MTMNFRFPILVVGLIVRRIRKRVYVTGKIPGISPYDVTVNVYLANSQARQVKNTINAWRRYEIAEFTWIGVARAM